MLHVDPNIFWTVVNLLILFILLRIFLFKPVLGMIEKRKAAIEGTLSDADQKNAAAQALKQQYESSLKDAKQESFQIVSDAKDRAQVQYNQIIDKANADEMCIRDSPVWGAAFFEMVFFSSAHFGRCISFLSSPIVALFSERFQIIINFPETPQKRHGFLPCRF